MGTKSKHIVNTEPRDQWSLPMWLWYLNINYYPLDYFVYFVLPYVSYAECQSLR